MSKFPRITSEDFQNALYIVKELLEDPDYLENDNCRYNPVFKEEIKNLVADIKQTVKFKLLSSEKSSGDNSAITSSEILEMAVSGYRSIINDKDATPASKTSAIKFLRDSAKELDDVKAMEALDEEIITLTSFIKQFLTRLLDEKVTTDSRTVANEFLNRLEELSKA